MLSVDFCRLYYILKTLKSIERENNINAFIKIFIINIL